MTTKGMTLNDITAADLRAERAHLARVLATVNRVLATVDPSGSNADALSADLNADHVLTYLDACADRLDAAAAEDDLDRELGDRYWAAYIAVRRDFNADFNNLRIAGIRAVRERLALVAEWLIAEAEQKGVAAGLAAFDSRTAAAAPKWPDSPLVWGDILDVPHNVRVTDRDRTEWRWTGAWEWFSVVTDGWITASFSERRDFAPFTEVL